MRRRALLAGTAALIALGAGGAFAQPSGAPLHRGILDSGSDIYDAQQFTLPAPEGDIPTPYLVTVLVPKGPAPASGFPVLYALDGKAVVERLTEQVLAALPGERPVIVAIGYDSDQRFAGAERSRDYTPPLADAAQQDGRGRPAGGFAPFYQRVVTQILPRAEALAPIDPARRWLWGHSYGGLFVLQAAMEQGDQPFSHFVAASPSLWWDEGRYFYGLMAALAGGARPAAVLDIERGSNEHRRGGGPGPRPGDQGASDGAGKPADRPPSPGRAAMPPEALPELEAALKAAGNTGNITVFDGLSHGETFGRSLQKTLSEISSERDR